MDSRLVRINDIAKAARVTRQTVRAWARSGKIPCWVTPGGTVRVQFSDLPEYIQKELVALKADRAVAE